MALLLIEGFEQYDNLDALKIGGWAISSGSTAWNVATGRHSGDQSVQGSATGVSLYKGFPNSEFLTVGMAINFVSGLPTINSNIFFLRNGSSDYVAIGVTTAGELQIKRGNTIIETTSGLGLVSNTWFYLEIDLRIHDTLGFYDVHVDGSQIMNDTNVDTKGGTPTGVDNIELYTRAEVDGKFDDLYILDDTGSDNTGLLGDCRIETLFPNADGNENDFTRFGGGSNNFEAVDDGAIPDDDTTYNHSATATDRELYGFAALVGNIDTVFGVQAKMLVRKEEAGFREVRVISRNNVTEVESGNLTLGINYAYKSHVFENNPDGGGDWTEATVNTAQFGIDLQT